ncbi:acetyltransferase [Actinoplanes sp. NEAU-A12]|uniref:Acetyltransferase n=1 Tax=Actinoplanes sandaracinus TaxID=3045177 RepID=A0ABT6WW72_9ACTN|nr:acetyltransferase [Actinoplanes sandaracinus]MDI6103997.1 acetyltransferase [Actinoplanes sandaracinus]
MTDLVIRPLVAGEENLFTSMPDPLPEVAKCGYADGIAGGGYRPEHTWVALHGGRVVSRAAWVLPPGAVGRPWLEWFDLNAEPEIGAELLRAAHAALGGPTLYHAALPPDWRHHPAAAPPMAAARLAGLVEQGERLRFTGTGTPKPRPADRRYDFRPAADRTEITALVNRIAAPQILTGTETARAVAGIDLATDPLAWLPGPPQTWRVALRDDEPIGLAAAAGDVCYPMIAYLGLIDPDALDALLADAVTVLLAGGAHEVVADADTYRTGVVAGLRRAGFRPVRARITFTPAG